MIRCRIKKWIVSIFSSILLTISSHALAITLNDISNFLLDERLPAMSMSELIHQENFFGQFKKVSESDDEITYLINQSPNELTATYIKLDDQWLLNDISFKYYSSSFNNCTRQQNAYMKHFQKRLAKPTYYEGAETVFWQIPQRDWGIWLMNDQAMNPFNQKSGCSSTLILIYSSLDLQNETEDL